MGRVIQILRTGELRQVRRAFSLMLRAEEGVERHLHGVVADTLAHPGSLVRAQLAYGLARRSGVAETPALGLAVAVEYFHAASLIFDDMPAMDDAASRRGRPCPHRVHGEAAATLGALALITRAYGLLWEALDTVPAESRGRAAALVNDCLGLSGILDGQARDVHFARRSAREQDVLHVAAAKTVPLIRLAIVLPALVAGAGLDSLARLERIAARWGLAYQILDDFKDVLLSEPEAGKSTRRDRRLGRPNLPELSGTARALARLARLLAEARREVRALERAGGEAWAPLARLQDELESARGQVVQRLAAEAAA